ncbi:hypothetical protein [Kitasatospora aureofaciens]|uniref:hypothetical protein n=1 Tax=Kitasatospora aureofaciens TaxID=1894 RepID=UPI0033EE6643
MSELTGAEDGMHPAVETLISLMPPHDGCGDILDWRSIEEAFGVALPSDFRDFIAVYGTGSIDDQLEIASPDQMESDGVSMLAVTPRASSVRWLEETGSGYPLWPESGSLIGWGRLKSYGEAYGFLYWRAVGPEADRWPVVVWKRDSREFVEYPHGMAEFLVRLLQESGSLPLDRRDVFGAPHSKFIHRREESRLNSENIDPWQYLEDLHEDLDDLDNDIAVEITSTGGESIAYRRSEVPIEVAARVAQLKERATVASHDGIFAAARPGVSAVAAIPQLVFLGIRLRGGILSIDASIALGSPESEPLLLSTPLRLSVRTSGPHGETISSAESLVVHADPSLASGHIEVTKDRPFTFSVSVPASESAWGHDSPVLDREATPEGSLVVMSITDEGVGAFRAAAGVAAPRGSENTILASWPPGT